MKTTRRWPEIWRQLGDDTPDWIAIPIGAGPLLVGCYKGFQELKRLGLSDKVPGMIGVQAAACFPIAEAFLKGQGEVKEWPYPIESNLSGICDPLIGYPRDGTLTRGIITHSGGLAVAVTDDEANRAAGSLARNEGIYCEPTAAAALRGNQVE